MFDWFRNHANDPKDSASTPANPASSAPHSAPQPAPQPAPPSPSAMSQFSQAVVQSLPINLMPQAPAGTPAPIIRQWKGKGGATSTPAGGAAPPPAPAPAAPPAPDGNRQSIRIWNDTTLKHPGHTLPSRPTPGPGLDEAQGRPRVWSPAPSTAAPSAVPDDARELAQEILRNHNLSAQLPAQILNALRGLVAPSPTPQQIKDGLAALAITLTALQAAHQEELSRPLPALLREWYLTTSWPASREWLHAHLQHMPFDAPEQFDQLARQVRARGDTQGADLLASHATLLREARRVGVDSAYQTLVGAKAFETQSGPTSSPQTQAHIARLGEWLRTPTWLASRQYLAAHQRELLVDETEMALELLLNEQTDADARGLVQAHQRIIRAARQSGVDAAYRAVVGDQAFQASGHAPAAQSAAAGAAASAEDVITVEQARDIAQSAINDTNLWRTLAPELRADLEGLLSPYASQEQIVKGKRAAVFLVILTGTQAVRGLLVEWMNTSNWQLSYEYLKARQAQLLTDEAEVGLRLLLAAETDASNRRTISEHQRLLEECRRVGLNAAYAPLLRNQGTWT